MSFLSRVRIAAVACACAGAAAHAAELPKAPPAPPPADVEAAKDAREAVVQRTVIDDGRAVIEELRIRGRLVKATVRPKDGSPSYEIIVGDGSRDLSEGRNNSRGATGQRVWNVLTF